MAQTAAHLADHVIPPVPVRQWVISVPKRLRGFLADRPRAVAAVTRIFLDEIERTLITASGVTAAADTPSASLPRLGGISFLHRFGSALNHHVHLHACVTDGVFMPPAAEAGCDAPPAFLPARPITPADLAALTERVRRRVIRWFRLTRLLDAAAAADILAWENSGFSDLVPPPRKHRHRYHGVFAPNHRLRRAVTALAIGNIAKPHDAGAGGHAGDGHATGGCCDTQARPRSHDTSQIAWAKLMARVGEEFPLECPVCGGDIRLREDGRQEPAHFEPEVRKRAKARMASPA
jgi:hypothetical protein